MLASTSSIPQAGLELMIFLPQTAIVGATDLCYHTWNEIHLTHIFFLLYHIFQMVTIIYQYSPPREMLDHTTPLKSETCKCKCQPLPPRESQKGPVYMTGHTQCLPISHGNRLHDSLMPAQLTSKSHLGEMVVHTSISLGNWGQCTSLDSFPPHGAL